MDKLTDTQQTAFQIDLQRSYEAIKSATREFIEYLQAVPTTDYRCTLMAIKPNQKEFSLVEADDVWQHLKIYSQFELTAEQLPTHAVRVPGVIQIRTKHMPPLLALIARINELKQGMIDLKADYKCRHRLPEHTVRRHVMKALKSVHQLQLTRFISAIEGPVRYVGLTVHKKPNSKNVSKEQALNMVSELYDKAYPSGFNTDSWQSFIDQQRVKIETLDEEKYKITIARAGAYRAMCNIEHAGGRVEQPTASMPVLIFQDEFTDVGLPREHDNKQHRSDRKLDLSKPTIPLLQLYILPIAREQLLGDNAFPT
ncbi:hypothetical protein ACFFK7_10020 [Pseudoalteromonas xiamenensis]|uniref:hypothetical protein n=1 Tax=Pseudoalteromonas xiamenensis TaxID=882626 RepID=UPI0035ED29C4